MLLLIFIAYFNPCSIDSHFSIRTLSSPSHCTQSIRFIVSSSFSTLLFLFFPSPLLFLFPSFFPRLSIYFFTFHFHFFLFPPSFPPLSLYLPSSLSHHRYPQVRQWLRRLRPSTSGLRTSQPENMF